MVTSAVRSQGPSSSESSSASDDDGSSSSSSSTSEETKKKRPLLHPMSQSHHPTFGVHHPTVCVIVGISQFVHKIESVVFGQEDIPWFLSFVLQHTLTAWPFESSKRLCLKTGKEKKKKKKEEAAAKKAAMGGGGPPVRS